MQLQNTDEFVRSWRTHAANAQADGLVATYEAIRKRQRWKFLAVFGRMLNPFLIGPILVVAVLRVGITDYVQVLLFGLGYLAIFIAYNWANVNRLKTNMLLRRFDVLKDLPKRSEETLRSALKSELPFVLLLRDFHAATEPRSATSSQMSYSPAITGYGDEVEEALPGLIPEQLSILAIHNPRDWSGGVDSKRYRYILCSNESWQPTVLRLLKVAEAVVVLQRGKKISPGLMDELKFVRCLNMQRKTILISHYRHEFHDPAEDEIALQITVCDFDQSIHDNDVREDLGAQIANVLATERNP